MCAHGVELRRVNQPFKAVCENLDLVVDAFKNDGRDIALHKSVLRFYDLHILWPYHHIDRAVAAEALVDTRDSGS